MILLVPLLAATTGASSFSLCYSQQVTAQDLDTILAKADKLLEEAKDAYEAAREKNAVAGFVDAGFKLEESRIKYIVLQEIGSAEKQKIAADRLRAVNQLSKLIHDGKVAVGGTPAEPAAKLTEPSPAGRPSDPAPSKTPQQTPAVPPGKAPDVSKRFGIPDAAKQKEAEKLIKELFKEQYARKAPADRKAFCRLLLDQAAQTRDDAAALWVLYREAQEIAIQNGDTASAMIAVDATARYFDVDAMSMKSAALAAASKTVKTADESWALTEALLRLVDEFIRADLYDAADKAAASAVQQARKAGDVALFNRATIRAKEVAEAKGLFQSMKSVLEALAKNPDEPNSNLEMGKFLCYVKGSWDLGLRFLVKGSDPTLKSLSERELAAPSTAVDLVALADAWHDLAEKDKSPLRKGQQLAHAAVLYEAALPSSTGLVRTKIVKRLAETEVKVPDNGINLLKLIDLSKDQVRGIWNQEGAELVSPTNEDAARVQIPYILPEEYDITCVVTKKTGIAFCMGLAFGEAQFVVAYTPTSGEVTITDGRSINVKLPGAPSPDDKPITLLFSVRKAAVSVSVNGRVGEVWKPELSKISLHSNWAIPSKKSPFIFTWSSSYSVSKISLVATKGQGKNLR